jgi:hypothetical protein|tara:strand:+ start:1572 stop:2327 length:756 start_codon:yes stop_codon:yes gene_type:complete
MVDSLRHHYLKTLGITEYIPRDFVDDSEEITQPSQPQPLTETRTAAISQLLADHSEAPKVKVVEKSPVASIEIVSNTETSSIETASVISDSAEVQIVLWQPADKLLVCSAVENELPSPEQLQLLSNILISMDPSSGVLPQLEIAQWPPFPNMQGGVIEARDFLSTLISARLESSQTQIILILGSRTADWVLSDQQQSDLEHGQVNVSNKVIAVMVPSLAEMIAQPNLKRQAWQTIKPLVASSQVHRQQETS